MGAMDKMSAFLEEKFMPIAGKIGEQKHLQSIRDGILMTVITSYSIHYTKLYDLLCLLYYISISRHLGIDSSRNAHHKHTHVF